MTNGNGNPFHGFGQTHTKRKKIRLNGKTHIFDYSIWKFMF